MIQRQINFRPDQLKSMSDYKEKTGVPMNEAVRRAWDAYIQKFNENGLKNERNSISDSKAEGAVS